MESHASGGELFDTERVSLVFEGSPSIAELHDLVSDLI
jgi:hypothetical protein